MLPFARVEVGSPGERRCRLCQPSNPATVWRAVADIAAELKEVVSEWTATVGPSVLLAGAEPFSHPSLPAIVAAARSAGFERIGLETDATALVRGENARGSLLAGVRHLCVLLFCVGELGDAMAGVPGASSAALQGLERFVRVAADERLAVAVSVNIQVCRHNVEHLPVLVAAAARTGAAHVVLEAAEGVAEDAATIVAAACDTGTVNRVWVDVYGLPLPATHTVHRGGEVLRA